MRLPAAITALVVLLSWNLGHPLTASAGKNAGSEDAGGSTKTATPIKHLVVIFDENNSFDHYFATYPNALPNLDGSVYFGKPKDDTPLINGLTPTLLTNNPNSLTGAGGSNPFRLDRSQAATCNNSNSYTLEQVAFDSGLLDKYAVTSATTPCGFFLPPAGQFLSMGYYDGNTVTALWNYAQHYAMSDNFFDTEFGVTLEGHLNLLSGQTHGVTVMAGTAKASQLSNDSVIGNMQPFYDDCAAGQTPNICDDWKERR